MNNNNLRFRLNNVKLTMVGNGAYANVYKYKDDFYNCYFALKKLKRDANDKEQERFKHEFELLSKYNHLNILKAYNYIPDEKVYIMEYCDFTLKEYINKNGTKISLSTKKDISLQFLNALKFIHNDNKLHRDISYNNILLKFYDNNLPLVKISDFGLVKDENLDVTSIGLEIRGTIIDDTLENFKDYNLKNEIYSIGVILYFIFTGKQKLNFEKDNSILKIVKKCVDRNHNLRYNTIDEIIKDISNIMMKESKENVAVLNSNIKVNSSIIASNGLNELSVEILKSAVEDNGQVARLRTLSGLSVRSGKTPYNATNPREEAELENTIELLENNEYIKANSYKRELFNVTKKGYDYFEPQYVYF